MGRKIRHSAAGIHNRIFILYTRTGIPEKFRQFIAICTKTERKRNKTYEI